MKVPGVGTTWLPAEVLFAPVRPQCLEQFKEWRTVEMRMDKDERGMVQIHIQDVATGEYQTATEKERT